MKKQTLLRIGLIIFLFAMGFIIGGGLSKTVKYLTGMPVAKKVIAS